MPRYNSNSEYQPIKINTNGITIFSNAQDSAALRTSYYCEDTLATLMLCFMPAVVNSDGKRSYPQDIRVNAALDYKRAIEFEEVITSKFMPDYLAGKPCCYGIFTNNRCDSVMQIGLDPNMNVFLRYSNGINQSKIASKTVTCIFDKTTIIKEYDPATGNCGNISEFDGSFFLFYKLIRSFNDCSLGTTASAVRAGTAWNNNNIMKKVNEIGLKLGIVPDVAETRSNSGFANNVERKSSSYYTNNNSVETTDISSVAVEEKSIDDLSSILGNSESPL